VTVRVFICDDHPIVRMGLSSCIAANPAMQVVGEGAWNDDTLALVHSSQPDVLIFELLEKTESRRQLAKLRDACPQAKLLAFTGNSCVEETVIALDCGAAGLLTKNCTPDEIRSAILKLDQGDNYLESRIAMRVVAHLRTAEARRKEAQALRLTVREEQVVKCLMEGMTNLQIANRLMISEKTVKHYVGCLKEKFSANNRLEIVLYAQRVALA